MILTGASTPCEGREVYNAGLCHAIWPRLPASSRHPQIPTQRSPCHRLSSHLLSESVTFPSCFPARFQDIPILPEAMTVTTIQQGRGPSQSQYNCSLRPSRNSPMSFRQRAGIVTLTSMAQDDCYYTMLVERLGLTNWGLR
jgi:hypothetical protein